MSAALLRGYTVLICALVIGTSTFGHADPLEAFQWTHRLILVNDETMTRNRWSASFKAAEAGLQERHICWFVLGQGRVWTNLEQPLPEDFAQTVRSKLFKGRETTEVVLIGKDGRVKSRDGQLDLEKLFDRIDAMPMRRAEMDAAGTS